MSAEAQRAEARFQKMGQLIAGYTRKHKMPEEDAQVLRRLLGYSQPNDSLLACDLSLRRRAGKEFGNMLVALREENPGLQFYFWTIIHPKGNASDRNPVVDIKGMQALADKVFRKFEMHGVSVLEIQALTNWPQGGEGRTLMAHVHGVSWSDRSFSCTAAMNSFAGGRAWPRPFGADPVDVQVIGLTEEDLRNVAYYIFKAPHDAKWRFEKDGRVRLKSTEKGYRPELAMRVIEGLSQLGFRSIIRSTGNGSLLRSDLLRRVVHRHKSRADWTRGTIDEWSVTNFWDRYRMKKRKKEYLPYTFGR